MHEHAKQQLLHVDCDGLLAPFGLIGCVIAARPTAFCCLRALSAKNAAVGLGSRPTPSRSMMTMWVRMFSHTPS